MNFNTSFLSVVIAGFLLVSCIKEKVSDNSSVSQIFPLKTGNSWTFKTYNYGSLGVKVDTITSNVGNGININGFTWFLGSSTNKEYPGKSISANDNEGNLLSFGEITDIDSITFSSIQFKKNAVKGESWLFQELVPNEDYTKFTTVNRTMTCLNSDTIITAPKGNFHCKLYSSYSYKTDTDEFVSFYYLAVGVGIIKIEQYENKELRYLSTLVDYKVY